MIDKENNMMRVSIYGHEYTVRAVANPEYIAEVAAYVDERMRETELNLPGSQSPARIAMLAAMSITDELLTERRKRASSLNLIEKRATAIATRVEEVLETSFKD
ncbi:MAG: cell division protein ZapA [Candidatus Marinimicrobia bacterium]|nr:cell division protein ZapA [Candidatus Neomarinimicrobiota bacterium]MCH7858900.1 cell division protein ZapA [Candidatus Neomarinimicrobiota bacterium]